MTQCPQCAQRAPAFDEARAPLLYRAPADWMVRRLKFHAELAHARLLGNLLAQALAHTEEAQPDRLVPMPLHEGRLRQRGFNQATEIARTVAAHTGVAILFDALRRNRATHAQSDLPAGERRANVRGAFVADGRVSGLHLALIDDVVTTGHTAAEAARTLKRAGAERVVIWCVARAPTYRGIVHDGC